MTSGTVEVVYISPATGRVTVNLLNSNEDVLIHIDARYDWGDWKNVLTLNSKKADGRWGKHVQVEGFPFEHYITVTLRVEIGESAFIISANGVELTTYEYRQDLGPPVDTITFFGGKGELKTITVYY